MINDLSIRDIHTESLKLLKELHKICEKLGIKYFLAYGTLLGAVRHKGFIPWDDDVDVWMFRDDFNKLVAYFDDFENQEKCKIHTRINTKNYPFGIARFSNDEFKYIDTQGLNEFQLGVFIDLYPLDNYSNNPKTAKKMMKKIRMQNSLYEWYINPFSTNFLKRISKKIVSSFFHFRYGEKYAKIVEKKINKYLNKYSSPNDAYVGIPSWTFALTPQKFDKTLFNDRVLLEFEDDKFYCPVGYCKILEICYGNYMQLPKEEDRVQYHNYKIIRRDNSI